MDNEKIYKGRILVAEDEEVLRNMLNDVLTTKGYKVDITSDGVEALEKVTQEDYDLLISDIRMPKMDGPGWLSQVKGLNDYLILVVSGDYSQEEIDRLNRNPGILYEFLSKPYSAKYLGELVDQMFEYSGKANKHGGLEESERINK